MNRYLVIGALLCVLLAPSSAYSQAHEARGNGASLHHAVFRCDSPDGKVLYTNFVNDGCKVVFLYGGLVPSRAGNLPNHHPRKSGAGSTSTPVAARVFQLASGSVVQILTYDATGNPMKQGSGVVLPHDLIATNCHVLNGGTIILVTYHYSGYVAGLRGFDGKHDVCLLGVPGLPLTPISFGSTKSLQVGEAVFAIGSPEGLGGTLSDGIVSSLRPDDGGNYIQTTAAISPGSSGGGLFDSNGRLLGLTTFNVRGGQQLNFALPVEWVEQLMRQTSKLYK
ncbi:MAG: S1C family serine protease [Rhodanobacteraceae bacterium]